MDPQTWDTGAWIRNTVGLEYLITIREYFNTDDPRGGV